MRRAIGRSHEESWYVETWSVAWEVQRLTFGETGRPYNNEYIWLTTWNNEGKIVDIRSYFDSAMSEEALQDPDL